MLLDYDDVLFLGGTYGHDVAHIALPLIAGSGQKEVRLMERIVAVLGLLQVSGKRGQVVASDLFLRDTARGPIGTEYSQFEAFLQANRVVRWEEELASLLDTDAVTAAGIKRASPRHQDVSEFLALRRTVKKAS